MEIKQRILELKRQGWSFGKIAKELGIGKTTAHTHYKDALHAEQIRSLHSERSEQTRLHSERSISKTPVPIVTDGPINKPIGPDLTKYICREVQYVGPLGDMERQLSDPFAGIISSRNAVEVQIVAFRIGAFLQCRRFGVTVFKPNPEMQTFMRNGFPDAGGDAVVYKKCLTLEDLNSQLVSCEGNIVIIDSLDHLGIDANDWAELIRKYPTRSFLGVKLGNYDPGLQGDLLIACAPECVFVNYKKENYGNFKYDAAVLDLYKEVYV